MKLYQAIQSVIAADISVLVGYTAYIEYERQQWLSKAESIKLKEANNFQNYY